MTCVTISLREQQERNSHHNSQQVGPQRDCGCLPAYSNTQPNHCLSSVTQWCAPPLTNKFNFTLSAAHVEVLLPHYRWGQFWLKLWTSSHQTSLLLVVLELLAVSSTLCDTKLSILKLCETQYPPIWCRKEGNKWERERERCTLTASVNHKILVCGCFYFNSCCAWGTQRG